MTKLELEDIGCSFGAGRVVAVKGFSLRIGEGEFVSLLGASGCGKTTTLRMIAGFIKPTSGSIRIDGEEVSSASFALPPEKREMSMIFQSYAIWPNMTVAENVAFGLSIRNLPKQEIGRRVAEILKTVHLAEYSERYPSELSGGQQQRIALARAIVVRPKVLLMDEPLSNLDASLREEMRSEIRRLHDQFAITTVYVTHDQSEAMVTSDRIVVMNRGRIEQVADPFSIYNKPETSFVASFIGRTNLIKAKAENDNILVGDFRFRKDLLQGLEKKSFGSGEYMVSIRPHQIHFEDEVWEPGRPGMASGTVEARAYLGEYWDYVIRLQSSGLVVKVTSEPAEAHEVGKKVGLRIDPERIVVVA